MPERSDEELVVDIQEGNIFAFETLVRRYQHKLHSFVLHMLHDDQLSHDVVQESFINLYKTIDRVDASKKFSSYVFAVTRNTTISFIRKRQKTISLDDIVTAQEDESLYEGLVRAEQTHMVAKAIRTLDEKYRRIIRLYYFDDLSYEEISKRLRTPVNTVRTHLRRAKEALRRLLTYEKH